MASEERDQLLANLRRLQLRHAANRIDDLLREAAQLKLGHLGFLARVVDTEVLGRNETATNRRIHEAHFPQLWRIEDYDFKEQPCLDRKAILDLAELGFLDRCESVFFLGGRQKPPLGRPRSARLRRRLSRPLCPHLRHAQGSPGLDGR